MSAGVEIERKFLVLDVPPEVAARPAEAIEQGYLALDGAVEVRLRRRGARHLLTVKGGEGLTRLEEELELDARRFEALWPLTEGRRVEKTRRRVALPAGLELELDEYSGALAGLWVAEVEFGSVAAGAAFSPPAWLGAEVTGDPGYANRSLATTGLPSPR